MIWVFGATGQLGFHLMERLGPRGATLPRAAYDLARVSELPARLEALAEEKGPPEAVINATAYNLVDKAESDGETAMRINARVPAAMAAWAGGRGVPFLHFSTDFVYSGEGEEPWRESDEARPLNAYALSKLAGESSVLAAHPRAVVLRTAWVYSHRRENFVLTMLKRARADGRLRVVADQIGHPTWADDLARHALEIADHPETRAGRAGGVYNLAGAGAVSRHDFAREILRQALFFEPMLDGTAIEPVRTADFASPAQRPLNTRLSLEKVARVFGVEPRPWREALADCMGLIYGAPNERR